MNDFLANLLNLPLWQWWLCLSVVLTIVEFFTAGFGVACFAVGTLCSMLMALCGLNIYWQLCAFIVGSVLAFCYVRPLVLKYLDNKNAQPTNLDSLVGREVRVLEPVDVHGGRVMLDGVDWRAVSANPNRTFAPGEVLRVASQKGNTLIVDSLTL